MSDQTREKPDLLDTPIMPTGSGVADLEIARELAAVTDSDASSDLDEASLSPTIDSDAARESESHPS